MHGRDEMHTKFWLENLKGRDHSEDLDVDRKREWILGKWCGKLWNGCIWLKVGTGGGLL
jgi:hypothetical protein